MNGRDQIFHILNPADLLISIGVFDAGPDGHRHIFLSSRCYGRYDPNLIIGRSNYDRHGVSLRHAAERSLGADVLLHRAHLRKYTRILYSLCYSGAR